MLSAELQAPIKGNVRHSNDFILDERANVRIFYFLGRRLPLMGERLCCGIQKAWGVSHDSPLTGKPFALPTVEGVAQAVVPSPLLRRALQIG
jgi:hypothetical protein